MGIMNKIKDAVNKPLTASTAYSMSKYGEVLTLDSLLNRFYKEIDELIKSKSTKGQFSLVFDIEESLINKSEEIIRHYSDLKFYAKILNNKTLGDGLNGSYLFISWRNSLDMLVEDEEISPDLGSFTLLEDYTDENNSKWNFKKGEVFRIIGDDPIRGYDIVSSTGIKVSEAGLMISKMKYKMNN